MTSIDPATLPWPGEELAHRVSGSTDRDIFLITGEQSVRDLEAALAVIHRQLSDYGTILDFGCGCGRIMLWLERLGATSSVHGVDIDERAITWAQENMPWATFKVNQPLPPLDYPDATFDLVYNHSVFTHIDEEYQDRWLAELRRVVKPGGHLILSVHGEEAFLDFEANVGTSGIADPTAIRRELGTRGISFIKDDGFTGGPFPDFYHSTFHAPWYVFEHWGRLFTVLAYLPRRSLSFQDFVLLRRPEDDTARGAPIAVSTAPDGSAEAPGGPSVGEDGLHRAGRLLHEGFEPGDSARRLVDRANAPRLAYQRQLDEALFTALHELRADLDQRTTGPAGAGVVELHNRLADAVRLQGERINRLEADLWQAMRAAPDSPPEPG
ncbi:MAG: hypothetical protein QOE93_356 [Actinomycetota bacterium]|jgi:SAM-dependent methyltransferase|nr:hypothetical protein [Actinomycetota bacterium]